MLNLKECVLLASPLDALQQVFVFVGQQGRPSPAGLRDETDKQRDGCYGDENVKSMWNY